MSPNIKVRTVYFTSTIFSYTKYIKNDHYIYLETLASPPLFKLTHGSMTKVIIGVCGPRRAGKDVVANYLATNYGFVNCKFADRLKEACKAMFAWSDDQLETSKDDICPSWGVTPRSIMQFIGTEVMQFKIQEVMPEVGRGFWVRSLMQTIRMHEKVAISDLRFLHEYDELKKLEADGAKLVILRVTRPGNTHDAITDNHISELEFMKIPIDYTIENSDTIRKLQDSVETFIKSL